MKKLTNKEIAPEECAVYIYKDKKDETRYGYIRKGEVTYGIAINRYGSDEKEMKSWKKKCKHQIKALNNSMDLYLQTGDESPTIEQQRNHEPKITFPVIYQQYKEGIH